MSSMWDNRICFDFKCGDIQWNFGKRQRKKYYQNINTGKITIHSKKARNSNKKIKKKYNGSKRSKLRSITNKIVKNCDYDAQNLSLYTKNKNLRTPKYLEQDLIIHYKPHPSQPRLPCHRCFNAQRNRITMDQAIFDKIDKTNESKHFVWLIVTNQDSNRWKQEDYLQSIQKHIINANKSDHITHDIYECLVVNDSYSWNMANHNEGIKHIQRTMQKFEVYIHSHRHNVIPVIFYEKYCDGCYRQCEHDIIKIPDILKCFERSKSLILFTDCKCDSCWEWSDDIKKWSKQNDDNKDLLNTFENLIIFSINNLFITDTSDGYDAHNCYKKGALYVNGEMSSIQLPFQDGKSVSFYFA